MIIPLVFPIKSLEQYGTLYPQSKEVGESTPKFFLAKVNQANDEGFEDWSARGFDKKEHAIESLNFHQIMPRFSLFLDEKDLLRPSDITLLNRMTMTLDGVRYYDNPYLDTRVVMATRDVFAYSNKGHAKNFDICDNLKASLNLDPEKSYMPFVRFRKKGSGHEEIPFRARVQRDLSFMGETMGNPDFAKSIIFI